MRGLNRIIHRVDFIIFTLWVSGMILGFSWAYLACDPVKNTVFTASFMGICCSAILPVCMFYLLMRYRIFKIVRILLLLRAIVYGYCFCYLTLSVGIVSRGILLFTQTASNLIILYICLGKPNKITKGKHIVCWT